MKRTILEISISTIFDYKIPFTPVYENYRADLESKTKNPWLFPLNNTHYLQKDLHFNEIIHLREHYLQDFGFVLALDYYKHTCKLKDIL